MLARKMLFAQNVIVAHPSLRERSHIIQFCECKHHTCAPANCNIFMSAIIMSLRFDCVSTTFILRQKTALASTCCWCCMPDLVCSKLTVSLYIFGKLFCRFQNLYICACWSLYNFPMFCGDKNVQNLCVCSQYICVIAAIWFLFNADMTCCPVN